MQMGYSSIHLTPPHPTKAAVTQLQTKMPGRMWLPDLGFAKRIQKTVKLLLFSFFFFLSEIS